jgi:hypothetical protein
LYSAIYSVTENEDSNFLAAKLTPAYAVRNHSDRTLLDHYEDDRTAATDPALRLLPRKAVIDALLKADADEASGLWLPAPVKAALATAASKLKKKPKRYA